MGDKNTTLAIFDFDGTLTEGHLWSGIAKHHKVNRIKRRTLYFYMLVHMPLWLASKIKLYSVDKNKIKWGEDLAWLFKGLTETQVQHAFEWVTDKYFMPLMRTNLVQILKEHKIQGHKVMILSGMFTEFLRVVGDRLGVDYVVGTQLDKVNDVYSGRIIQPLCFGNNKAKLLTDFINQNRLNINLRASYAYADSFSDSYLLRLVGNPVAVYPDKGLYRIALENRWQIIDGKEDNITGNLKTIRAD